MVVAFWRQVAVFTNPVYASFRRDEYVGDDQLPGRMKRFPLYWIVHGVDSLYNTEHAFFHIYGSDFAIPFPQICDVVTNNRLIVEHGRRGFTT